MKSNNCCIVGRKHHQICESVKNLAKTISTKKSEKFDLLISREAETKRGARFFRSSTDRILWEILPKRAKSNLSLIIFYNLEVVSDFIEGNSAQGVLHRQLDNRVYCCTLFKYTATKVLLSDLFVKIAYLSWFLVIITSKDNYEEQLEICITNLRCQDF